MAMPSAPSVPGCGRDPLVGELRVVGVVRADGDDLLAAVARLGHEVRVRGAGHGDVGAPHDQVGGVPPVGRLGHVGLVAEHLRARRPAGRRTSRRTTASRRRCRLMKRAPAACEAIDIAGIGENPKTRSGPCASIVWTWAAAMSSSDLGPRGSHQAALAARPLVAAAGVGVVDDGGPGLDRVAAVGDLRRAVGLEQHAADVGVAHARGRVGVPGEGRAAGAAARLVLRGVRSDRRVVGLLGLPGDDPVLDVHLPRARAGAVHAVRGAHDLVVAPAVAVERVAPRGRPAW